MVLKCINLSKKIGKRFSGGGETCDENRLCILHWFDGLDCKHFLYMAISSRFSPKYSFGCSVWSWKWLFRKLVLRHSNKKRLLATAIANSQIQKYTT